MAEQKGFSTFLSQGAVGGGVVAFAYLLFAALVYPNPYNFLLVALLPFYLFIGGFVGAISGVVVWVAGKTLKRRLGILLRIIIAITFFSLVSIVIGLFIGSGVDWSFLLGSFVSGSVVGVPVGLLAGSNIRPCHFVAYGSAARRIRVQVLFKRAPIRISRRIEELTFSFIAGVPLRVTSLLGLLVSMLAAACFGSFFLWDSEDFKSNEYVIGAVIATVYFGATACVSFAIRRKSIVLPMALLLNAPLSIWILDPNQLDTSTDFLRVIAFFLVCFWLLFVTGLLVAPAKEDPIRVEHEFKN